MPTVKLNPAELRRLYILEERVREFVELVQLRKQAGWHKVPMAEFKAVEAALTEEMK